MERRLFDIEGNRRARPGRWASGKGSLKLEQAVGRSQRMRPEFWPGPDDAGL